MTNFYQTMRPLIEEGYVYAACPPLYKVTRQKGKKEEITYLYTKEELDNTDTTGCNIQRYKGLENRALINFSVYQRGFTL